MAAEQRHGDAAILRHRHHRRLGPLVGEERRQRADQDAGGAQAHDRLAFGEQPAQMRADIVEPDRGLRHARREAVQPCPGQRLQQPLGRRPPARAEHEDRRHCQASPRRCTSTIEK